MSPAGAICKGCGEIFTDAPVDGRCPECAPAHRARDEARRRAKPQRKVWDSARWKVVRAKQKLRDRYTCQMCGRHQSELADNEVLVVDHKYGLLQILQERRDPYAFTELQTLCSTCSGHKDGGGT